MISSYLSLNTVMELLCLITAFFCLINDKQRLWRLIIVLLFVTYFCETFGRYIYMAKLTISNHWVYNILILFQVSLFHMVFAKLFCQYSISKYIIYFGVAILAMVYGYDIINAGFYVYSQNTYNLLSVFIVIYGFVFYYYLLTDDAYIDLKFLPSFWWVAGIMIFCFGSITCSFFENQLYTVMKTGHHLAYYIFRVLNVILYGFWIFAFICRRWLYKPSKQLSL